MELVAILAVRSEGMVRVGGAFGEKWGEGLTNEAPAVITRLPHLVHSEDTVLVEAGAVVNRSDGLSEVEEAGAESVVVHGVPVVAELELRDMCVRHENLPPYRLVVVSAGTDIPRRPCGGGVCLEFLTTRSPPPKRSQATGCF